jgi:hypothetical protein
MMSVVNTFHCAVRARQCAHHLAHGVALHCIGLDQAQNGAAEITHALALGAQQHLAAQQVQRLDAGGAFVQRGDAGIAGDLLHAVFADVAVAAKHLDAQVGRFQAHLGQKALEDGGVEAQFVVVLLVLGLTDRALSNPEA